MLEYNKKLQQNLGNDEVQITPLEQQFPMLPQQLGIAQIIKTNWQIFKAFDLKQLYAKHKLNKNQFHKIEMNIESKKHKGLIHLIKYQVEKIDIKFSNLINANQNQKKRGLINIMGKLVKSITGNLDSDDGIYYDQKLKELSTQQTEMKEVLSEELKSSLSINRNLNATIEKINLNNKILTTQMNKILNQTSYTAMLKAVKLEELFETIIATCNIIEQQLSELENAISFAKLEILHPTISHAELYHELKKIENILINDLKLPYIIDETSIIYYEQILKTQAFQFDSKIVFVLNVPIVSRIKFNYYKMFNLPQIEEKPNVF